MSSKFFDSMLHTRYGIDSVSPPGNFPKEDVKQVRFPIVLLVVVLVLASQ